MTCHGPDCERPSARKGLCWAHLRQVLRGKPLRALAPRQQRPDERLKAAALAFADVVEAVMEYADATTSVEYERAEARLRMAALNYARRGERDEAAA